MSYCRGKTNPTDRQGRIMLCFKCNSVKLFAQDSYNSNFRNNVNVIIELDQEHMTILCQYSLSEINK